jgi:cytoskeletal protein CcmA (bactofilin family)
MAEIDSAGVIGRGLFIKGELHGEENLVIEGRVEGVITLKKHLVIERTGVILADVNTENITIKGEVRGNLTAAQKVEVHADARVIGDITAPRVVIADGATFKGHIEMSGEGKLPEAPSRPAIGGRRR